MKETRTIATIKISTQYVASSCHTNCKFLCSVVEVYLHSRWDIVTWVDTTGGILYLAELPETKKSTKRLLEHSSSCHTDRPGKDLRQLCNQELTPGNKGESIISLAPFCHAHTERSYIAARKLPVAALQSICIAPDHVLMLQTTL